MATKLVKQLQAAADAYYNGEELLMTDEEYDEKIRRLEQLDPTNPYLNKIGQDDNKEFKKMQHRMPMGSQQKAANADELKKWYAKGYCDTFLLVNHKIDGLSVELVYEAGKFKYGITRGNGVVGDDITKNVLRMNGLVKKISIKNASIRGEIVMRQSVFNKIYKPRGHKMARTMAAGLTKRPDGVGCEHLDIIVYDINDDFSTESEKMEYLESQGFQIAETRECKGIKNVLKWYQELIDGDRENLDIEIDGLVVKCDTVDQKDMERTCPNRQIALKFPSPTGTTKLLKVVWNASGTTYTPVGHIEPVDICGSTVTKASLCNPGIMKDLGLRIGSVITVSKRNDIIPKIESVVERGNGKEISIPENCVNCDATLVCTDTKLYCPNEDCCSKLCHQIRKWVSVFDIKEFGKELITAVSEKITTLADLYKLDVKDIEDLELAGGKRLGSKNATKALNNLKAVNSVSLSKFIAGFDIATVSEKTMDVIVEAGYDTLDKLRSSNLKQLTAIKGIGESKANALLSGLGKYKKEMNEMLQYVSIAAIVKASGSLDGSSVCFTGKASRPRKELEDIVRNNGGVVKNTVGRGLTYLVTDDPESGSAKNQKAQSLGVTVISEDAFFKLL